MAKKTKPPPVTYPAASTALLFTIWGKPEDCCIQLVLGREELATLAKDVRRARELFHERDTTPPTAGKKQIDCYYFDDKTTLCFTGLDMTSRNLVSYKSPVDYENADGSAEWMDLANCADLMAFGEVAELEHARFYVNDKGNVQFAVQTQVQGPTRSVVYETEWIPWPQLVKTFVQAILSEESIAKEPASTVPDTGAV
jgi:hypothetical protein